MNLQRLAAAAVLVSLVGCLAEDRSVGGSPLSVGDLSLPVAPTVARLQQAEDHIPESATAPTKLYQTSKIRAVVNGSPILDEEVREAVLGPLRAVENMPEPMRTAKRQEIFNAALEQLIERELIYRTMEDRLKDRGPILNKLKEYAAAEFEKQVLRMKHQAKIETEEEFKEALKQQGITLSNLKRGIERSFMANEFMRNMIFTVLDQIGLQQIRQYYDEHPGEFMTQDRVRWQDVFIDAARYPSRSAARAAAEAVSIKAHAGEDFAVLVQQYDQGTSKGMPNGEGIGQERGQIRPPELEEPLFAMKAGEVGPIVEMPFGYHVYKLVNREYAGRQPFDAKTQEELTKKVKNLLADREYKRLLNEMRRKANIQKFMDN